MKYRFRCQDCDQYHTDEALLLRAVCPVNSEHTVDASSLVVLPLSDSTKDYKKLRKELIDYVIANGESMTADQLKVAAQHFCLPTELRDMFYTVNEQVELGRIFHLNSCESRKKRYNVAVAELFNRLSYEQTYEIICDLTPGNLIWNYINLGVEGVSEGDDIGVFDYFLCTPGTKYAVDGENPGFLTKGYTPRESTLEDLSQRIVDILKNGAYTLDLQEL